MHKFTNSPEEHVQNAKIYQDWLNKKKLNNDKTEIKQRIVTRTLGLTLAFSAAAFAFAQQQKVAVSGKITDKNGAAVPYASITFANKTNNALSDGSMTDDKGNYSLNLTPGTYSLQVETPDLRHFRQKNNNCCRKHW